jgi:hypothetical protein
MELFRGIGGASFLASGTQRDAFMGASTCDPDYNALDAAHDNRTAFHTAADQVLLTSPNVRVRTCDSMVVFCVQCTAMDAVVPLLLRCLTC